ncbi:MAG: hypothetical protein K2N38_12985, partial [Oscillospiraceae bacterium]|nr:hypothetical protein [Oscillospiraceae bacterium]
SADSQALLLKNFFEKKSRNPPRNGEQRKKNRRGHTIFALGFEKIFRGDVHTRRGVKKFGMDYFCVRID